MWRGVARASIVAAALLASSSVARADQAQDECVDGYEQGQRLRLDGKFLEAREKLLVCSRPICPKVTQPDCAKWLGEVEARLPTVIVHARDAEARDLDAVAVMVDGQKRADRLDGRPMFVDPGAHTLRYEIDGGKRFVEERVLLTEGEKDRRLSVNFARASFAPGAAPPVPEQPRPGGAGLPAVSWVLGGVSALALTGFVGFAVQGRSAEGCVPNCTRADVDAFRRDYLVADVSLGVAVVAGGLAVLFALTRAPAPPPVEARLAAALSPR